MQENVTMVLTFWSEDKHGPVRMLVSTVFFAWWNSFCAILRRKGANYMYLNSTVQPHRDYVERKKPSTGTCVLCVSIT